MEILPSRPFLRVNSEEMDPTSNRSKVPGANRAFIRTGSLGPAVSARRFPRPPMEPEWGPSELLSVRIRWLSLPSRSRRGLGLGLTR